MKLRSLGWSLSNASEMSWSCSVIVQLPGIWFIYRCRRVADENILWRSLFVGAPSGKAAHGLNNGQTFVSVASTGSGTISQKLSFKEFCHHAKGHRLFYPACQHRLRRQVGRGHSSLLHTGTRCCRDAVGTEVSRDPCPSTGSREH